MKPASPSLRSGPPARGGASAASVPSAAFCLLPIKAIPGAPRSEVCGWLGEAVKVKVQAPPVEGKANEALCAFLAERLGLPRRAVALARGDTSRHKVVRVDGLTREAALAQLGL